MVAGGLFPIILMPMGYGLAGFIGGALASFVYNQVAKIVGGIEIEVE
ncbi:MAG: hypothetical protein LBH10_03580 [Burkholderiaceae bacterium]|jgi:hypothetical protein|nr:hypothetical protein [Burkholderiaceae bacterium]